MHPSPRSINSGSAPTDLQARTGLLTPPGMILAARSYNDWDLVKFILAASFLFLENRLTIQPKLRSF
jgi:hypothetical protein